LSGTLMNFVGPVISATWFPINERLVATSFLSLAAGTGVSLGFIIGPIVVPFDSINRDFRLQVLYWTEAGLALLIVISIAAYFPSRPPNAPSLSAAESTEKKNSFGEGYKKILLFKSPQARRLWILTIPYAITTGVFGGWGAVLYPNLKSFNFSENSAGWLGSISTLSGCVGGVIVGILANRFSGKMKTIIIINFIISGIAFLWFCFFVFRYISSNTISIFTVGIIAGTCIITPTPLFFELTMETIHPDIPEGSATSFVIHGNFGSSYFCGALIFTYTRCLSTMDELVNDVMCTF